MVRVRLFFLSVPAISNGFWSRFSSFSRFLWSQPQLQTVFEKNFLKNFWRKKKFFFLLNEVSFFDVCLANPSSQQTDVSNIKTVTGVDDKSYRRSKVSFHFFQNWDRRKWVAAFRRFPTRTNGPALPAQKTQNSGHYCCWQSDKMYSAKWIHHWYSGGFYTATNG